MQRLKNLVNKYFLVFLPDICLQELSQFACAVEIAYNYLTVHSNCSNCEREQYFSVIKSRQSLTWLMHFELSRTDHVVRIKGSNHL